jgi:hypothetical protein
MDETNSKIIMLDENHMYMNDNYKKHEIFGWMWSTNELLDDNWKYSNCLDEIVDRLSVWMKVIPKQLWWMAIIGLTKFSCPISSKKKRCQRWNSKELHYNAKGWNNNLCKLSHIVSQR